MRFRGLLRVFLVCSTVNMFESCNHLGAVLKFNILNYIKNAGGFDTGTCRRVTVASLSQLCSRAMAMSAAPTPVRGASRGEELFAQRARLLEGDELALSKREDEREDTLPLSSQRKKR